MEIFKKNSLEDLILINRNIKKIDIDNLYRNKDIYLYYYNKY